MTGIVDLSATIKNLFATLVRECGGVEAAGAYLGVSHQRVSAIQRQRDAGDEGPIKPENMPTLLQVVTLERALGQAIVTGSLAAMVEGAGRGKDLMQEACEVTEAAADLLRVVRTGGGGKDVARAVARVQRELDDVPAVIAATA